MRLPRSFVSLLTIGLLLALASPASAQEAAITLTTPYTDVAVEPGHTVTFDLSLSAPQGEHVTFDASGLPEGWTSTLQGAGFVIDGVTFDSAHLPALRLAVAVPADATDGVHMLTVTAKGATGTARLQLALRVKAQVGGGVTMTSDFPNLEGPSGVKFSYRLSLSNASTEEVQFGLSATGPDGWQVSAQPSGQSLASTVTVQPGGSATVNVETTPPSDTPAGSYDIDVTATGGAYTATTHLTAQITGTYSMVISTQDQRMNASVVAGKPDDVQLVVFNTGSAPLDNVQLRATPPSGWDATFSPETLAEVPAGGSAPVTLTITPSRDAVAGDYRLTVSGQTTQAHDSIELRTTVKTSAAWGVVGAGLIVLVLGGLGVVFRRFGRR